MTWISSVRVRNFRTYAQADVDLKPGINVISGENGAGKTNFLEAVYTASLARSFKTASDRDLVKSGSEAAHLKIEYVDGLTSYEQSVSLLEGQKRRIEYSGTVVSSVAEIPQRPRMTVFTPDRLALVKEGPSVRRAHLDQFALAIRPSFTAIRSGYHDALKQRNSLISRLKQSESSLVQAASQIEIWDKLLSSKASEIAEFRNQICLELEPIFSEVAGDLGLTGTVSLDYRSKALDGPEKFRERLSERLESDLSRGFTQSGPHRDEVSIKRDGKLIQSRGSQGEQRLTVLALLLAEAKMLIKSGVAAPIILLDDVMSELDKRRRSLLFNQLEAFDQVLITGTENSYLESDQKANQLEVKDGQILAIEEAADESN